MVKTTIESIAKVLIMDNQDRVLTLTLSEHRANPEKSYLPDLPGGIVDEGESAVMGAVREVQEECGVVLDSRAMRLVYAATAHLPDEMKSVTKLLYAVRCDQAPSVVLSWEHSDYQWVAIDELKKIDFRDFFNTAIEYVVHHRLLGGVSLGFKSHNRSKIKARS